MKKVTAIYALAPALAIALAPIATAEGTVNTPIGVDTARNCVYNGFHYTNPSNIAPGPHCFFQDDNSTVPPIATTIDKSKTKADLEKVENTSPLDPKHYLAKDTFAYKKLTGNEPLSPYSKEISRTTTETNRLKSIYTTGFNAGGVEGSGEYMGGGESIPIFTVDSSNPYQHFVTVSSSDARVTSSAKNAQMMTGKIPLPEWYQPSTSGDHSIAIYDVATGIYRSLYYFVPKKDSTGSVVKDAYTFNAGGYAYANPNFEGMNDRNYWMNLISSGSSVVGMTNELTQIGVEEIRNLKINHAISMTWEDYSKLPSFPAKIADGRLDKNQFPFVPQAGMRFTLPKDFDVDKYAKQNRIDPLTQAILHAVQEYGGFIADRNFFGNAFNLENPTGYAPYARQGKNVYIDDPEIKAIMDKFQPHRFPTDKLQWMPSNYMNDPSSTVKKMEYPVIDYNGNEAYQPDAVYSTVYQDQYAFERTGSAMQMSPGLMNNTYMYKASSTDDNGLNRDLLSSGGRFSMNRDDQAQFVPTAGFTGTTDAWYTDNYWIKANWDNSTEPAPGPVKTHRPTETSKNGHWIVNVIPKGDAIARTDDGWLIKGTKKSFDVTANDEAGFGQSEKTSGAISATVTGIKLLNAAGQEVSSYSDDYGTYSVDGKSIMVEAKGTLGYTPIVRYKAVTSDGRSSATGYFQPLVVSRTSTVSELDLTSTPSQPVESAPTLVNDTIPPIVTGGSTTVTPLSNDSLNGASSWSDLSLVNGAGKSAKSVTNSMGTWSVTGDNRVTFQGAAGYKGDAMIQYRATSSNGKSAMASVNVKVVAPSKVSNQIGSTTGMKSVTFLPLLGATTGDPQVKWNSINMLNQLSQKATTVSYPVGTFKVNGDGSITFTPSGVKGVVPMARFIVTTTAGETLVRNISITLR